MCKQTCVIVNGRQRHISNFEFASGIASGRISGREVTVSIPDGSSAANAKRMLVFEHDRKFDDRPLTKNEVCALGRKAERNRNGAIRFRSKRLDDGSLRVKGTVNGKEVMLMYDGIVMSEFMETSKGRPFISKIREDMKRKCSETAKDYLVDADFMNRFKGKANVVVGQDSMIVFGKPIYLKGLTISEALEKINLAIDEYEARKAKLDKMIDETLSRLSA